MKTTGTSGIFMPTSLACPLYCGQRQLWLKLPSRRRGSLQTYVQADTSDSPDFRRVKRRQDLVNNLNLVCGRSRIQDGRAAEHLHLDVLALTDGNPNINRGVDRLADEDGAAATLGHETNN